MQLTAKELASFHGPVEGAPEAPAGAKHAPRQDAYDIPSMCHTCHARVACLQGGLCGPAGLCAGVSRLLPAGAAPDGPLLRGCRPDSSAVRSLPGPLSPPGTHLAARATRSGKDPHFTGCSLVLTLPLPTDRATWLSALVTSLMLAQLDNVQSPFAGFQPYLQRQMQV